MVDTSDAWIVERTGIRERHILDPSLAASDLATEAGRAGLPDGRRRPGGRRLHHRRHRHARLSVPRHGDLRAAEAGRRGRAAAPSTCRRPAPASSTACRSATRFIARGQFKRVLVIGVEILSRIIDWTDRNTCVLFGDGAGAVVLAAGRRAASAASCRRTSTPTAPSPTSCCSPAGGSREPLTAEALAAKRAVREDERPRGLQARRAQHGRGVAGRAGGQRPHPDDVAWVIAHQANLRIIEGVAERVGIPHRALLHSTSSATATPRRPRCRSRSTRRSSTGKLQATGDLLLFTALGGGLAWASAAVRW